MGLKASAQLIWCGFFRADRFGLSTIALANAKETRVYSTEMILGFRILKREQ